MGWAHVWIFDLPVVDGPVVSGKGLYCPGPGVNSRMSVFGIELNLTSFRDHHRPKPDLPNTKPNSV
eukprot:6484465-Amphidinium_carterae.1